MKYMKSIKNINSILTVFLLPLFMLSTQISFAQNANTQNINNNFPSKPIRLVVPYPAGGPVDAVARLISEGSKATLGQAMVVDNKPGAGGNLGVDIVAKSAADGYTIVMGAVATHAINPALSAPYSDAGGTKVPYDPIKDFAPILLAATVPNVLVVSTDFAAKHRITNFDDFMRLLKANPGKFNMASGGNGSAGHLVGEILKSKARVFAVHIPYGGAAPAQLSLLAGQTDFMFDNVASATANIRAGKLKALAVTSAQRATSLADVPTIAELGKPYGLADMNVSTWFGLFAPAGTPQAVVNLLNKAAQTALASPEAMTRLNALAAASSKAAPLEFAAFVKTELEKYQTVIKAAGVKL